MQNRNIAEYQKSCRTDARQSVRETSTLNFAELQSGTMIAIIISAWMVHSICIKNRLLTIVIK